MCDNCADVGMPYNIKLHDGYIGAYTLDEAEGCYKNGTRVVKVKGDPSDSASVGKRGVVLGSINDPSQGKAYFIEWDNDPRVAVLCVGWKLEALS